MQEEIKQFEELMKSLDESIIVNTIQRAGREDVLKALGKKPAESEKPFWESKKFWGGFIALIIMIADSTIYPGLWKAALPIMVYIFGQGLADLGKNKGT